jgi:lysophospholipase L1-like esterase
MKILHLILLALLSSTAYQATVKAEPWPGVKRVVILGDSITYGGQYVDYLETYFRLQYSQRNLEILNLGLPSENVSGLSEPGHAGGAFPRPDLHERLDRVLAKTKPDLVLACYGMNDGIYYPLGEERFQKFREGIEKLRAKVQAAGGRIIHLTPPVFDPVPIKSKVLPAGRDEYRQPFEGYNRVLDRYSEWLISQRAQGWEVLDTHSIMNAFLAARRKEQPDFKMAGDGVHMDATGHWLVAREILRSLGASATLLAAENAQALLVLHPRGSEIFKCIQQKQRIMKDAWLTDTGHKRPKMAVGLPLKEASEKAAELERKIQELLKEK